MPEPAFGGCSLQRQRRQAMCVRLSRLGVASRSRHRRRIAGASAKRAAVPCAPTSTPPTTACRLRARAFSMHVMHATKPSDRENRMNNSGRKVGWALMGVANGHSNSNDEDGLIQCTQATHVPCDVTTLLNHSRMHRNETRQNFSAASYLKTSSTSTISLVTH